MNPTRNLMMPPIKLQTGKIAMYLHSRKAFIPDINPDREIDVHEYHVPCPFCDQPNLAHSTNGWSFYDHQLCCRGCGIYFRPIQKQ